MTPSPVIKHSKATIITRVNKVLTLKTVLSIIKDFISIIGPKIKKAKIEPRLNEPTNDNAKKASTEEQIEITNAKTIKAITESDGELTNRLMVSRGIKI